MRNCEPDRNKAGERVSLRERGYMLGKFGDWAYVRASDTPAFDVNDPSADHAGFIRLSSLNAPASTTHLTAFVTKDKVNLRSEPNSQSGAIIGGGGAHRRACMRYGLRQPVDGRGA